MFKVPEMRKTVLRYQKAHWQVPLRLERESCDCYTLEEFDLCRELVVCGWVLYSVFSTGYRAVSPASLARHAFGHSTRGSDFRHISPIKMPLCRNEPTTDQSYGKSTIVDLAVPWEPPTTIGQHTNKKLKALVYNYYV